jgi:hypothetical protein
MNSTYRPPDISTGSPNMAAAKISNVVVTSSQLKPSNGGKRKKRRTIKKGGGSTVYGGPTQSTTTLPTNYPLPNTGQNLATHTANAQIQSRGDSLTGGRKSKRNKRKRRKSKRRK